MRGVPSNFVSADYALASMSKMLFAMSNKVDSLQNQIKSMHKQMTKLSESTQPAQKRRRISLTQSKRVVETSKSRHRYVKLSAPIGMLSMDHVQQKVFEVITRTFHIMLLTGYPILVMNGGDKSNRAVPVLNIPLSIARKCCVQWFDKSQIKNSDMVDFKRGMVSKCSRLLSRSKDLLTQSTVKKVDPTYARFLSMHIFSYNKTCSKNILCLPFDSNYDGKSLDYKVCIPSNSRIELKPDHNLMSIVVRMKTYVECVREHDSEASIKDHLNKLIHEIDDPIVGEMFCKCFSCMVWTTLRSLMNYNSNEFHFTIWLMMDMLTNRLPKDGVSSYDVVKRHILSILVLFPLPTKFKSREYVHLDFEKRLARIFDPGHKCTHPEVVHVRDKQGVVFIKVVESKARPWFDNYKSIPCLKKTLPLPLATLEENVDKVLLDFINRFKSVHPESLYIYSVSKKRKRT